MIYQGKSKWTNVYINWLKSLKFGNPVLQKAFDDLLIEYSQATEKLRYYDEQITQLEKIARCLSQMTCMCKHVLTFSLFLGKSNTEIADIKGYDINTVKSKKHDCLKTLKYMVSGAHF